MSNKNNVLAVEVQATGIDGDKDIKIGCIVQVFDYCKQDLEMYKVLNVYVPKDNEIVFKCNKMKFNEKKELVITNVMRFIDGKDIMSIYNKINHE